MLILAGCGSPTVIAVHIDAKVEQVSAEDTGGCEEPVQCGGCGCNPTRVFDGHVELPNVDGMREEAKVAFEVEYRTGDTGGESAVTGVVRRDPVEVVALGTTMPLYSINSDASLVPAPDAPMVSDDGDTLTFEYVNCGARMLEVHTLLRREPRETHLYAPIACCGWAEAPSWLGAATWILVAARRRSRG